MSPHTLLLASALLLGASPALAWDYKSEKLPTGLKYVTAWQGDDSGANVLQLECEQTFTNDPDVMLVSSQPFDPTARYPETVPLSVTIDGRPIEALQAIYVNVGGKLGVAAYETDDARVKPVIDAIRTATTGIEVRAPFGDQSSYGITDAATTIASFEHDCDALDG